VGEWYALLFAYVACRVWHIMLARASVVVRCCYTRGLVGWGYSCGVRGVSLWGFGRKMIGSG
jgi:hypothetical protein